MCEGPDGIYICLDCARRCVRLIEQDYQLRGMAVPPIPSPANEQTRQAINSLVAEITQLSNSKMSVGSFYEEFLPRVVAALAAVGGAVWMLDGDSHLRLAQCANIDGAGLPRHGPDAARHTALLYKVLSNEEARLVPPRSLPDGAVLNDLGAAASNPTDAPFDLRYGKGTWGNSWIG